MWSLGVILYSLVSADFPFAAPTDEATYALIKNGDWEFDSKVFEKISSECKDLISKLLVVNPKERLTASQALKHPWFKTQNDTILADIDNEIINRLKNFKG